MNVLTKEMRQKIHDYLPRYPNKQAVTLPALHIVQDELRCVPLGAVEEIAELLDLHPAQVHDTLSFYGFFRSEDKALGKHRVWVCRSLPCMLRGGEELLAELCEKLNVQPGETTSDGRITLEFAECLGACAGAPCMLIGDQLEGCLRLDLAWRILAWLDQLRGLELASPELLRAMQRKGRAISIATEGSDELRLLQYLQANASVGGQDYTHVILQPDARKIEALEEFLHGTQERIGIGGSVNVLAAEIHVKRFMRRHRQLLGISQEDIRILEAMLGEHSDA